MNPNIPDFAQLVSATRFLYQSKIYDTTPLSNMIVLDRAVSAWHENITVFLNKGILTPGLDYDRLDANNNVLPLYDKLASGQTTYPLIQKINIKQRITSGSTVLIIYSVFGGDYIDYSQIDQYVMDRLTDFGLQDFINQYLIENLDNVIASMLPSASETERGIIQIANINDSESNDKAITPSWMKNQQILQMFKLPLVDITNESSVSYGEMHITAPRTNDPVGPIWSVPEYDFGKHSIEVFVGGTLVQPNIAYTEIAPISPARYATQIQWLQLPAIDYNIDIYTTKSNIDNEMIVHDRLYSTSFISEKHTRPSNIIANTNFQVPTYVVGNNQLEIFVDGIRYHNGIQYNEIGDIGSISQFIQFVNDIIPSYEIGVYVKPQYNLISLYNKPAMEDYTFYISSTGNDTNSGDSSVYSWKTWEHAKKNLAQFNVRDKKFTLVISGKIDENESSVNVFDVPGFNADNLTITGINPQSDGFNGILQFENNSSASLINMSVRQIKSMGDADFKSDDCLLYLGGQTDFSQSNIFVNGKYQFKNTSIYTKSCPNVFETNFGKYVFDNVNLYSNGDINVTDSIFNIKDGSIVLLNEINLYGTITTDSIATLRSGEIINSDFINLSTMTNLTMVNAYKFLPKTGLEYDLKIFAVVNADGTLRDSSNSLSSIGGGIIKSDVGIYQIKHNLTGIKCVVTPVGIDPIIAVCDNEDSISTVRIYNISGTLVDNSFTFALS